MFKRQEDADEKGFDKAELSERFRGSDAAGTKSMKMGD